MPAVDCVAFEGDESHPHPARLPAATAVTASTLVEVHDV